MVHLIRSAPIVILAAGRSARLGRPKQLLSVDGISLLRRSVYTAVASGMGPVYVTIGSNAEPVLADLEGMPATAVMNHDWKEGMASSIRAGLKRVLQDDPTADGVLLMVCDQPAVDANTLKRLAVLQREADTPVAASSFAGTTGPPALFHRALFDELMGLSGDTGAKRLIKRHSKEAAFLECPEGERDIDTEADYEDWLKSVGQKEDA